MSYVDERDIWLVRKSQKKSVRDSKLLSVQPRKVTGPASVSHHHQSVQARGRTVGHSAPQHLLINENILTGGLWTAENSSVSATNGCRIGLSTRQQAPPTERTPRLV